MRAIRIGNRLVGDVQPVFVVAEIGINHNGELSIAKNLIDCAVRAGCDAVKFQKRTPDLCVPANQRSKMRETPWGYITYLEYRNRVEFGIEDFCEINRYCQSNGITWAASCWDEPSVDFMEVFSPPFLQDRLGGRDRYPAAPEASVHTTAAGPFHGNVNHGRNQRCGALGR